jgi:hypothetical protein
MADLTTDETSVTLTPEQARALGVADGDPVRVVGA